MSEPFHLHASFECGCGHKEILDLTGFASLAFRRGRAVYVCPQCGRGHDRPMRRVDQFEDHAMAEV